MVGRWCVLKSHCMGSQRLVHAGEMQTIIHLLISSIEAQKENLWLPNGAGASEMDDLLHGQTLFLEYFCGVLAYLG